MGCCQSHCPTFRKAHLIVQGVNWYQLQLTCRRDVAQIMRDRWVIDQSVSDHFACILAGRERYSGYRKLRSGGGIYQDGCSELFPSGGASDNAGMSLDLGTLWPAEGS